MLNPTQPNQNSLSVAFNEIQVAENWSLSRKTLQAWRLNGGGPKFLKIGRSVRYLASDLTEFEAANKKESTSQKTPRMQLVSGVEAQNKGVFNHG